MVELVRLLGRHWTRMKFHSSSGPEILTRSSSEWASSLPEPAVHLIVGRAEREPKEIRAKTGRRGWPPPSPGSETSWTCLRMVAVATTPTPSTMKRSVARDLDSESRDDDATTSDARPTFQSDADHVCATFCDGASRYRDACGRVTTWRLNHGVTTWRLNHGLTTWRSNPGVMTWRSNHGVTTWDPPSTSLPGRQNFATDLEHGHVTTCDVPLATTCDAFRATTCDASCVKTCDACLSGAHDFHLHVSFSRGDPKTCLGPDRDRATTMTSPPPWAATLEKPRKAPKGPELKVRRLSASR